MILARRLMMCLLKKEWSDWILNPAVTVNTNGIAHYTAYKTNQREYYDSYANLDLTEAIVRSLHDENMQQWQAVIDACNELTGGSTYAWDVANECIAYIEHPRVTCTTTESCQQFEYLYRSNTNKYYSTPDCVAEIGAAGWWGNTIAVPLNSAETEYACRGDSATGDRAYLSKVINPNYDPSMVESKTIKLNVVAQKIISNTSSPNQGTSLFAEAYLENVAQSIFSTDESKQFVKLSDLIDQFEENKVLRI